MHNHDEVDCCVGQFVYAGTNVSVISLIEKAGAGGRICRRVKKKEETEFPGYWEKGKVMRVLRVAGNSEEEAWGRGPRVGKGRGHSEASAFAAKRLETLTSARKWQALQVSSCRKDVSFDNSLQESLCQIALLYVLWSEYLCHLKILMLKPNPYCDGIRRWGLLGGA